MGETKRLMTACPQEFAKDVIGILLQLQHEQTVNRALRDENASLRAQLQAALLENAVLKKEASTDSLTGAYNRKFLMGRLEAVQGGDRRDNHNNYLLMIDLDGFKPINDRYGHAAGDKALQVVVEAIQSCVREDDVVSRLGGDEFAVLLVGASRKGAKRKAEQIIEILDVLAFEYGDHIISLRGSVVLCGIKVSMTPEQILEHSDKEMYEVKAARKGRYGDKRNQPVLRAS